MRGVLTSVLQESQGLTFVILLLAMISLHMLMVSVVADCLLISYPYIAGRDNDQ